MSSISENNGEIKSTLIKLWGYVEKLPLVAFQGKESEPLVLVYLIQPEVMAWRKDNPNHQPVKIRLEGNHL